MCEETEASVNRHSSHRHRAQSIIQWKGLDQLEEESFKGLYGNVDYSKGSSKRIIICETIYGCQWWTVFQVLTTHLCYPTVIHHGIQMSNCFLPFLIISLSLLLPCLLYKIANFRHMMSSSLSLLIVRLLSVLPIVHDKFAGPWNKLILIFVGGLASVLALMSNWWDMSTIDRYRKIYYHFFGLVLAIAMRLWAISVDPVSVGVYASNMGIILGVFVIVVLFVFDKRTPVLRINEILKIKIPHTYQLVDVDRHVWVWLGLGFGCHMFIVQLLYSNASVLPMWSGITSANILQSLVVAFMCFGFYFGINKNLYLIISNQWLSIGVLMFFVFFFTKTVYSFIGGLLLTTHISSVWPLLCFKLTEPLSLSVAFSVYIFLVKISYYEVLWFPVSQLLLLPAIIIQWSCLKKWIEYGISTGRIKKPVNSRSKFDNKSRKGSHIMVLGQIIRRLSTVSEFEDEDEEEDNTNERKSVHKERLKDLLNTEVACMSTFDKKKLTQASIVLFIISLLVSAYGCYPHRDESKEIDSSNVFNVTGVVLNAGSCGADGRHTEMEMTELIKTSGSSIVCLFDITREFTGSGVGSVNVIGRQLAMTPYYSLQRNPKVAMLTNVRVISDNLSSWDSVTLSLKSSSLPKPLIVTCLSSSEPELKSMQQYSSPASLTLYKGDQASTATQMKSSEQRKSTNRCSHFFLHINGFEKVSENCVTTANGFTDISFTTVKQKN